MMDGMTDAGSEEESAYKPLTRKYLQELRKQLTDTTFKIANGLKASGPDGIILMRKVGISDEDIAVYRQLPDVLGLYERVLRAHRVPFEIIKVLINAETETRLKVLQAVITGGRVSANDFVSSAQTEEKTELESLQERAQIRLRNSFESRIPDAAIELHTSMVAYNAAPEADRLATRDAIIDLSKKLLAAFEFTHGTESAAVEDWAHVGLEDGLARKLAEAHYALREIAAGNFHDEFPAIIPSKFYGPNPFLECQLTPWRSENAVAFLTGKKLLPMRKPNFRIRPVKKLRAIELCAGIGGQALGISRAGFEICGAFDHDRASYDVLQANRILWRPHHIDIRKRKDEFFDRVEKSIVAANGKKNDLDLLSGSLPWKNWRYKKKGAADKADLFKVVEEAIRRFSPKAFLFETVRDFIGKSHENHFNDLVATYAALGYRIEVYDPPYADLGILEKRDKIFLVGLKSGHPGSFKFPAINAPVHQTLAQKIWDLEFRHWSAFSKVPVGEDDRTETQKKFDRFCWGWMKAHSSAKAIPSFTRGLTKGLKKRDIDPNLPQRPVTANAPTTKRRGPKPKPPRPTSYALKIDPPIVQAWEQHGFNVTRWDDGLSYPDGRDRSLLAFSPQVLKRLHGFPDDWRLFGGKELQIEQLLDATPPVVTLAIGRAIHGALTGEPIDINAPGAMTVDFPRADRPPLPSLNGYRDPKLALADAWRDGVLAMKARRDRSGSLDSDNHDDGDFEEDPNSLLYEEYLAEEEAAEKAEETWSRIRALEDELNEFMSSFDVMDDDMDELDVDHVDHRETAE
ncbi:DNA cytosine methyltransferase [Rhizobium leguminosarum]|uniref:DNA cytosine methyltransferase n=1 Tax=Rhizobium leguminosarum TaxID=384 RepID=UPI001C95DCEC|nr:DNA cytosine methyltransferase [Rhizobium leguminosarum]MBY5537706.1 DNA cytosine methyltransferase [Rhizobium leguminosarum]